MRAECGRSSCSLPAQMPIVVASGTGTMTSHIVGVKDQVLVATITSKIGTSIFSRSEIKSVEDLKGKTVATGRPGAFLDATVRYVLRSKFGLIPDRDVKLLPTGEPYLGLQALERGVVDAAAMSIPQLFIARKAGFQGIGQFRQARRRVSLHEYRCFAANCRQESGPGGKILKMHRRGDLYI